MKVSVNWLSEFVAGLPTDPAILIDALTSVGLEVEGSTTFGEGLEALTLVEVVSIEKHPARDKLRLVTVSLGVGGTQTVVCGASNVPPPGGIVVLAPLGTHLPAVNMTLTPRDIGGVTSEGMLCSETELGLASEAEGILTFAPKAFPAGKRFLEAFPSAHDTVLELGITPNRPDALGHVGVARDLAARLGLKFAPREVARRSSDDSELQKRVQLSNEAPDLCPRYGAAVVDGVTVRRSPEWLRWRLFSLGIRPISNVVDITNLLLLEYGNPMHAFDLERVAGKRVVVRRARDKEPMKTLDGKAHELNSTDLVIADERQPSALAGIMGGAVSEIQDDTTSVFLECAYFEPTQVRRTARRLGLHTDSSYRFERGVDYGALETVLARACELLTELGGGTPVPGQWFVDGQPAKSLEIRLRGARLNALLDVEVDFDQALSFLTSLGFDVTSRSDSEATVRGASHRPDVTIEADLIEEVARMIGLDRIPTKLPVMIPASTTAPNGLERRCRSAARELGLSEAVCYAFVSEGVLKTLSAPAPLVRLQNPLSEDRDVMTTSLLPGLLESFGRAQRHGESSIALFSVASVFVTASAKESATRRRTDEDRAVLPEERSTCALLLGGERWAYLQKPSLFDVYDVKGMAVALIERLVGRTPEVRSTKTHAHLHPRAAADLTVGDVVVGRFGTLHPDVCDALELDTTAVHVAELDLAALETLAPVHSRFSPIPRLPAVTRDIAVEAPDALLVGDLRAAIETSAGDLCESVELFDVFRPEAADRRSLAFRLVYRDPKASTDPERARTLTDKEVDARQAKVVARVTEMGAVLRA